VWKIAEANLPAKARQPQSARERATYLLAFFLVDFFAVFFLAVFLAAAISWLLRVRRLLVRPSHLPGRR
jgi:hypothetical protein